MSEPSGIALVRNFPTVEPDKDVIEYCEAFLARAKSGEIRGLALVAFCRDGSHFRTAVGMFNNLYEQLGCIRMLEHMVMQQIDATIQIEDIEPPKAT